MATAKGTHDRILQEGLALVSQEGVQGVTLGVLASRVGMSKSGLFAHFRSKEEVQIEVLQHMARFAHGHVVEPAMAAPEGLPRLEELIFHWLGWAPRSGLPGGCPVAAALFELDDIAGPVRDQVLAMEREWRSLLTQLTSEAVAHGHLRADLDVEQFIWELYGIYLSHHTSQRFMHAEDADVRASTALRALVDRARP